MSEYKIDVQTLADEFAAAMEPQLDKVGTILEANGLPSASRVVVLHAACEIFATFWPNAMAARERTGRKAMYGCLPNPTLEEKLEGVREAICLFQQKHDEAARADPSDAPMPLVGRDAQQWHNARREAFQYVLEMLNAGDWFVVTAPPTTK